MDEFAHKGLPCKQRHNNKTNTQMAHTWAQRVEFAIRNWNEWGVILNAGSSNTLHRTFLSKPQQNGSMYHNTNAYLLLLATFGPTGLGPQNTNVEGTKGFLTLCIQLRSSFAYTIPFNHVRCIKLRHALTGISHPTGHTY